MQSYIAEQVAHIDRMIEENRTIAAAAHKCRVDQLRFTTKHSWLEAMPDWLVATGLVSGLITLLLAATWLAVALGGNLLACH